MMAWNPSPKVAALRDYSEKFGGSLIILLAYDGTTLEGVSFGKTKAQCAEAKRVMDTAYEAAVREIEKMEAE